MDIQKLDRELLNSEFETGKALYDQLRSQGYAPYKIAGMIYRAGRIEGKKSQRDDVQRVYKQYHDLKNSMKNQEPTSQPEATAEGENNDE